MPRPRLKEQILKTKAEIAVEKFLEGYNCAQSVLYAFCDDVQIEKDFALKIASGFGGGMGLKEEVCGAVTGGIIVIGAKYGRGESEERAATLTAYTKTRELIDRFADQHGTFVCRELTGGCDFTTAEGRKEFKEKGLFNRICKACVEDVVNILEIITNSSAPSTADEDIVR